MTGDTESKSNSPGPPPATPPLPLRRFQFSLATLLWLTTVVACLAALATMYLALRKATINLQVARSDIAKYRDELGYFDITDPKRIQARAVKTTTTDRWSWRIYLPEGRRYRLSVLLEQIPGRNIPKWDKGSIGGSLEVIEPGTHAIDAFAERGRDGEWHFNVEIDRDGSILHTTANSRDELLGTNEVDELNGTVHSIAYPTLPFALLRARHLRHIGGFNPTQPFDGVLIWIEEAK